MIQYCLQNDSKLLCQVLERSFQQDADNGLPDQRLAKRDGDGRRYTKSETLTKVRGVISNIILHMVADQDMLNLQEC